MISSAEALAVLRRYWGYDSFRPMQEKIVASIAGGHDACVVMPTGGGKSLCYQLPAAMLMDKTVIVVSPLLALMQDQVNQLAKMGIPAAMVNSTLSNQEQFQVMKRAVEGEYRLLYLSPERLVRTDTVPWLKRVPLFCFAIDEAHCISEWGHEFRPEYRKLSSLRECFPECAIAAFTASATRQVRHDIIDQLRLRNPHKYIASFHRSNLRYLVRECDTETQPALLVRALKEHKEGNVIVYSPTINRVTQTVAFLETQGIAAVPYHAKMDKDQRKRNQDRWMSDEVRVLVGTIAFGLGINKPAVRSVVHLALPKSIEQYYQEAGRAGRDSQPSDCVLLWQKKDLRLLIYFIDLIEDPAEKRRAWDRYHEICGYAESNRCRHRQICLHFGETPKWERCGACDACAPVPAWLHDSYGRSKTVHRDRSPAAAPSPKPAKKAWLAVQSHNENINPALRECLQAWRKSTAQKQGIAAFTIFHNSTLDELCSVQPRTLEDVRAIRGFGERKTGLYGREILEVIKSFKSASR